MKSFKRKKKQVIVCPKCSESISSSGSFNGWLLPEHFTCEKCGYSGYLALAIEKDENLDS